jgi:hypothetical protein
MTEDTSQLARGEPSFGDNVAELWHSIGATIVSTMIRISIFIFMLMIPYACCGVNCHHGFLLEYFQFFNIKQKYRKFGRSSICENLNRLSPWDTLII